MQNKYILEDTKLIDAFLQAKQLFIDRKKFIKVYSLSPEHRKKFTSALDETRLSISLLGDKLTKNYVNLFKEVLAKGMNSKEIERCINLLSVRKIRETAFAYNNKIKTLATTFSHGIDNLINFNEAEKAGVTKFKYVPQREFCQQHLI